MFLKISTQLNGEESPHIHYALVFDGAYGPADLIPYRNALTSVIKEIVSNPDVSSCLVEEMFWLVQLSEFINSSLDDVLMNKNSALHFSIKQPKQQ